MSARTERIVLDEVEEENARSTEVNNQLDSDVIKDSRYAWILCLVAFLTHVLILGFLNSFGILYVEFITEMKTTSGKAAWVGSGAYGLSMAFGPISSIMVKRFGSRSVTVGGSVLCAFSVMISSAAQQINQLFGTFSILFGMGASMALTPTILVAQQYFDKYVGIVIGVVTAGGSVGMLIISPLLQLLIERVGWRNSMRIYGCACAMLALTTCFNRPLEHVDSSSKTILQNSSLGELISEVKLWRDRVFTVWVIAICFVMFGFYVPYIHLVAYAADIGLNHQKGSILLLGLGVSTGLGRLLFGKIAQVGFFNRLHLHQMSIIITGSLSMLLPLIHTFGGLLIYVFFIGFVDGCYVVLLPLLTCSLVTEDKAMLAWGLLGGIASITFTIGPPVAGFIYDATGSYLIPFHVAGIMPIIGALILFLIPWAQRTARVACDLQSLKHICCSNTGVAPETSHREIPSVAIHYNAVTNEPSAIIMQSQSGCSSKSRPQMACENPSAVQKNTIQRENEESKMSVQNRLSEAITCLEKNTPTFTMLDEQSQDDLPINLENPGIQTGKTVIYADDKTGHEFGQTETSVSLAQAPDAVYYTEEHYEQENQATEKFEASKEDAATTYNLMDVVKVLEEIREKEEQQDACLIEVSSGTEILAQDGNMEDERKVLSEECPSQPLEFLQSAAEKPHEDNILKQTFSVKSVETLFPPFETNVVMPRQIEKSLQTDSKSYGQSLAFLQSDQTPCNDMMFFTTHADSTCQTEMTFQSSLSAVNQQANIFPESLKSPYQHRSIQATLSPADEAETVQKPVDSSLEGPPFFPQPDASTDPSGGTNFQLLSLQETVDSMKQSLAVCQSNADSKYYGPDERELTNQPNDAGVKPKKNNQVCQITQCIHAASLHGNVDNESWDASGVLLKSVPSLEDQSHSVLPVNQKYLDAHDGYGSFSNRLFYSELHNLEIASQMEDSTEKLDSDPTKLAAVIKSVKDSQPCAKQSRREDDLISQPSLNHFVDTLTASSGTFEPVTENRLDTMDEMSTTCRTIQSSQPIITADSVFQPSVTQTETAYQPADSIATTDFQPKVSQTSTTFQSSASQATTAIQSSFTQTNTVQKSPKQTTTNSQPKISQTNRVFHPSASQAITNFQPPLSQVTTPLQPKVSLAATIFQPKASQDMTAFQPKYSQANSVFHPSASQAITSFQPSLKHAHTAFESLVNQDTKAFQPVVSQTTTVYQPAINQLTTSFLPVDQASTAFHSKVSQAVSDFQSTVNQASTDFQPTVSQGATFVQSTISQSVADFQPKVSRSTISQPVKAFQPTFIQTFTGFEPMGSETKSSCSQEILSKQDVDNFIEILNSSEPDIQSEPEANNEATHSLSQTSMNQTHKIQTDQDEPNSQLSTFPKIISEMCRTQSSPNSGFISQSCSHSLDDISNQLPAVFQPGVKILYDTNIVRSTFQSNTGQLDDMQTKLSEDDSHGQLCSKWLGTPINANVPTESTASNSIPLTAQKALNSQVHYLHNSQDDGLCMQAASNQPLSTSYTETKCAPIHDISAKLLCPPVSQLYQVQGQDIDGSDGSGQLDSSFEKDAFKITDSRQETEPLKGAKLSTLHQATIRQSCHMNKSDFPSVEATNYLMTSSSDTGIQSCPENNLHATFQPIVSQTDNSINRVISCQDFDSLKMPMSGTSIKFQAKTERFLSQIFQPTVSQLYYMDSGQEDFLSETYSCEKDKEAVTAIPGATSEPKVILHHVKSSASFHHTTTQLYNVKPNQFSSQQSLSSKENLVEARPENLSYLTEEASITCQPTISQMYHTRAISARPDVMSTQQTNSESDADSSPHLTEETSVTCQPTVSQLYHVRADVSCKSLISEQDVKSTQLTKTKSDTDNSPHLTEETFVPCQPTVSQLYHMRAVSTKQDVMSPQQTQSESDADSSSYLTEETSVTCQPTVSQLYHVRADVSCRSLTSEQDVKSTQQTKTRSNTESSPHLTEETFVSCQPTVSQLYHMKAISSMSLFSKQGVMSPQLTKTKSDTENSPHLTEETFVPCQPTVSQLYHMRAVSTKQDIMSAQQTQSESDADNSSYLTEEASVICQPTVSQLYHLRADVSCKSLISEQDVKSTQQTKTKSDTENPPHLTEETFVPCQPTVSQLYHMRAVSTKQDVVSAQQTQSESDADNSYLTEGASVTCQPTVSQLYHMKAISSMSLFSKQGVMSPQLTKTKSDTENSPHLTEETFIPCQPTVSQLYHMRAVSTKQDVMSAQQTQSESDADNSSYLTEEASVTCQPTVSQLYHLRDDVSCKSLISEQDVKSTQQTKTKSDTENPPHLTEETFVPCQPTVSQLYHVRAVSIKQDIMSAQQTQSESDADNSSYLTEEASVICQPTVSQLYHLRADVSCKSLISEQDVKSTQQTKTKSDTENSPHLTEEIFVPCQPTVSQLYHVRAVSTKQDVMSAQPTQTELDADSSPHLTEEASVICQPTVSQRYHLRADVSCKSLISEQDVKSTQQTKTKSDTENSPHLTEEIFVPCQPTVSQLYHVRAVSTKQDVMSAQPTQTELDADSSPHLTEEASVICQPTVSQRYHLRADVSCKSLISEQDVKSTQQTKTKSDTENPPHLTEETFVPCQPTVSQLYHVRAVSTKQDVMSAQPTQTELDADSSPHLTEEASVICQPTVSQRYHLRADVSCKSLISEQDVKSTQQTKTKSDTENPPHLTEETFVPCQPTVSQLYHMRAVSTKQDVMSAQQTQSESDADNSSYLTEEASVTCQPTVSQLYHLRADVSCKSLISEQDVKSTQLTKTKSDTENSPHLTEEIFVPCQPTVSQLYHVRAVSTKQDVMSAQPTQTELDADSSPHLTEETSVTSQPTVSQLHHMKKIENKGFSTFSGEKSHSFMGAVYPSSAEIMQTVDIKSEKFQSESNEPLHTERTQGNELSSCFTEKLEAASAIHPESDTQSRSGTTKKMLSSTILDSTISKLDHLQSRENSNLYNQIEYPDLFSLRTSTSDSELQSRMDTGRLLTLFQPRDNEAYDEPSTLSSTQNICPSSNLPLDSHELETHKELLNSDRLFPVSQSCSQTVNSFSQPDVSKIYGNTFQHLSSTPEIQKRQACFDNLESSKILQPTVDLQSNKSDDPCNHRLTFHSDLNNYRLPKKASEAAGKITLKDKTPASSYQPSVNQLFKDSSEYSNPSDQSFYSEDGLDVFGLPPFTPDIDTMHMNASSPNVKSSASKLQDKKSKQNEIHTQSLCATNEKDFLNDTELNQTDTVSGQWPVSFNHKQLSTEPENKCMLSPGNADMNTPLQPSNCHVYEVLSGQRGRHTFERSVDDQASTVSELDNITKPDDENPSSTLMLTVSQTQLDHNSPKATADPINKSAHSDNSEQASLLFRHPSKKTK